MTEITAQGLDWNNLSDHQKKWWTIQIKRHGSVDAVRKYQRQVGADGGRSSNTGGFFANPELARQAGRKGKPNTKKG